MLARLQLSLPLTNRLSLVGRLSNHNRVNKSLKIRRQLIYHLVALETLDSRQSLPELIKLCSSFFAYSDLGDLLGLGY